mgnify:CR=1 FL=1
MYLPELVELESFLTERGNDQFYDRWCIPFMKRDAIIGPEGSIEFIKQFIESEYNTNKADSQPIVGSD